MQSRVLNGIEHLICCFILHSVQGKVKKYEEMERQKGNEVEEQVCQIPNPVSALTLNG